MRLFLPQSVEREDESTPPFLTDREEDSRFNLLRETTICVKEGKQRLPTPEKNAIMELSNSFEKRRLGKQQQILSEMTQRCRVQEVSDLSSKMSAKCDLKLHSRGPNFTHTKDNPFYNSTTNTFRGGKHRISDANFDQNNAETGNVSPSTSRRQNVEKAYKSFPARRIMRQPTKIHVISTNLPKVNTINKHRNGRLPGEAFVDSYRSPRYTDLMDSSRRVSHPSFNTPQYVPHSKADPLAPLVLPRLSIVDANYQDRIDSYMSSSRVASFPRAKTFLDTASTSGRSYKSLLNFNAAVNKYKNTSSFSLNHTNGINTNGGSNNHNIISYERSEFDVIPGIPRVGDDEMNSLTSAGLGM